MGDSPANSSVNFSVNSSSDLTRQLISDLASMGKEGMDRAAKVAGLEELEALRVEFFGKKGKLSAVLRGMGKVPGAERPAVGSAANEWKAKVEGALQSRKAELEETALGSQLASEKIDVTLPAREIPVGALHPVTQTTRSIVRVLSRLGFEVATGPEVETEYLCFDAVNIPADHPARDMQDTFFVGPGTVLRTHTTPVQMRTMLKEKPPVRILCPGAVYRADNDATHSPMFHQIEGLWVDKKVTMADLVGTLDFFAKEIFGSSAKVRLRPSYFPFVEPGVEVDVGIPRGKGKVDWMEILGAGMVHPELFAHAGYEAGAYRGFAFGMGIERIAMVLHGIRDLRLMYQNDIRFLSQF